MEAERISGAVNTAEVDMILKDVRDMSINARNAQIEFDRLNRELDRLQAVASRAAENNIDARLCSAIEKKHRQVIKAAKDLQSESKKLEVFFENVDDVIVSAALRLKYIEGLSWTQTATKLGGNTSDSLRMMCTRFLEGIEK